MHEVIDDIENPENYWISNLENGRYKCHFCERTYAYVASLKTHEIKAHSYNDCQSNSKENITSKDELQDYMLMVFKLTILHKNLDTAVDMGDGERCVRSAKYELPIYNKTHKIKYAIGSIQLSSLTEEVLSNSQRERLIANRFVNIQGGVNNNIALDEYVEMLNRDSKLSCSGYKTKDSIIEHSREYPILSQAVKYVDEISEFRKSKGFHHLPSYKDDVHKVAKDLFKLEVFQNQTRKVKCKNVCRNPYSNTISGLATLIHRHRSLTPYRRLKDPHI